VNGLLILDKAMGMTSHDVVARTRRIVNERSIGHLGTLDPMATGVLPLLLGRYTRLAQFFGRMEKSYTGTIRFGQATDTYCRRRLRTVRRRLAGARRMCVHARESPWNLRRYASSSMSLPSPRSTETPRPFAQPSPPVDTSARLRTIWASEWAAARTWHRCAA
jgi:hypothetical protein